MKVEFKWRRGVNGGKSQPMAMELLVSCGNTIHCHGDVYRCLKRTLNLEQVISPLKQVE